LLWSRPRKMRRWDRSSSVELLWSHYECGILLWSGQRKLRSLHRSKTLHTRWDRSSSVELLWCRLRKMRGWLRSKIGKGIGQLLGKIWWAPSCQTVFWRPCPGLSLKICRMQKNSISLLKSLPCAFPLRDVIVFCRFCSPNFQVKICHRKKIVAIKILQKKCQKIAIRSVDCLRFLPWNSPGKKPKNVKCDCVLMYFCNFSIQKENVPWPPCSG